MKYCNRCFRNIIDDVNVCPHCGKADKLVDYDKEKRGEDFTCNDDSTFSSHIDREDAYNIGEKAADTVYGNEKVHDLDDCENAPDEEQNAVSAQMEKAADIMYLRAYLRSLSNEQRRSIISAAEDDIRRRFGLNPSEDSMNGEKVNINGREISIEQFNQLKKLYTGSETKLSDIVSDPTKTAKASTLFAVWLVVTVIFPPLGIILGVVAMIKYFNKKNN